MSRYEYDIEAELDDSFDVGVQIPSTKVPLAGTRITTEQILKEEVARRARTASRAQAVNVLMGTQVHQWELSLPGGSPIVGRIAVPEDESHSDLLLTTVFNKLFPSVKVQHIGGGRFVATFENRTLGKFDVPHYTDSHTGRRVEVDIYGRPRYFPHTKEAYRDLERVAEGWLRTNLILEIKGLDQHHPPYEPRLPQKSRVHVGTKPWIDGLSSYETARIEGRRKDDEFHAACKEVMRKPGVGWRPVNEGAQDMAQGGVNLSLPSGGGATNMAHATQMEQTSRAGERVAEMGNSGSLVLMHMEGKVIG